MTEQAWIIIGGVITTLLGGGIYKIWFIDRKKNNADILGTFATEWQKLYLNEQAGMKILSDKFNNLLLKFEDLERQNREKIGRINTLEEENRTLKKEVKFLKEKLNQYEQLASKTEVARQTLHESVDTSIDDIQK